MGGVQQNIVELRPKDAEFPEGVSRLAKPPQQLFVRGVPLEEILARPRIAIVGSRKVSAYGKAVTAQLAGELARLGVVVVSGLALGVDGIAHRAALEVGGVTAAVLACGVDRIYPSSHYRLGADLLAQGGALISEYPPGTTAFKDQFIARNRLVAALADGLLITEAAEKSGSLHTARFALEQGKEVLAVPGNITSETSRGTNNLIKAGATPVTELNDILHALGWEHLQEAGTRPSTKGSTPEEQLILDLLAADTSDGAVLLAASKLEVSLFNQTLTMLEITGKVRALGGNHWALY